MSGNMNSGGSRMGAGRKPKPLAEKILMGNPGKKKLKVMKFGEIADLQGVTMPKPKDYLSAEQRDGKTLKATEIYEASWIWINERGCAKLVNPELIEQYSVALARYIQCDMAISTFGFLSKHPISGNPIQSPYVAMANNYSKIANNMWNGIYQIIKDNCATEFGNPLEYDRMWHVLNGNRGRG